MTDSRKQLDVGIKIDLSANWTRDGDWWVNKEEFEFRNKEKRLVVVSAGVRREEGAATVLESMRPAKEATDAE